MAFRLCPTEDNEDNESGFAMADPEDDDGNGGNGAAPNQEMSDSMRMQRRNTGPYSPTVTSVAATKLCFPVARSSSAGSIAAETSEQTVGVPAQDASGFATSSNVSLDPKHSGLHQRHMGSGKGAGGGGKTTSTSFPSSASSSASPLGMTKAAISCSFSYLRNFAIKLVAVDVQKSICTLNGFKDMATFVEFLQQETPLEGAGYHYVDICWTTEEDVKTLTSVFSLDEFTVEDLLDTQHADSDKFSSHEKWSYMFASIETDISKTPAVVVGLLLFKDWMLAVHNQPCATLDTLMTRFQRDLTPKDDGYVLLEDSQAVTGPAWFLYTLLDIDVDGIITRVSWLTTVAQQIDELTFTDTMTDQEAMLRQISSTRTKAIRLRQLVFNKRRLIGDILSQRGAAFVPRPIQSVLRDVLAHVSSCENRAIRAFETVNQANANFLARLSVDKAKIDNVLNEIMRKLCWATIALSPINIFQALGGMNVRNPWMWTVNPEYDDKGQYYCRYWYIIVGSFTTFTAVWLAMIFWSKSSAQKW